MRVINLILVLSWCGLALADDGQCIDEGAPAVIVKPVPELAKEQGDMAMRFYNLQRFAEALTYFRSAYLNRPDPILIFDVAQTERQLGCYAAAAKSYRLYIGLAGPEGLNREQARRLAQQMDAAAKQANEAKTAPPPITLGGTWPASSGPATVEVTTPKPKPERRAWYRSTPGWALIGSGVALGVVGGALLTVAAGNGQRAESAATLSDFQRWHSSDLSYQQGGWPTLGIGAGAIVAGVIVMGVHR